MRPSVALSLLVVAAVSAALPGCRGKSSGGTPESAAQAFADAMAKGDTKAAADQWNYITEARASNENWDDIPSGQRSQIIGKLKQTKQGELEPLKGSFGPGMRLGAPQVGGTAAVVRLEGGPAGALAVQLEQADGDWGVTGVAAAQ